MENQDPPLLRLGTLTKNCGSCINFYLLQRGAVQDDGRCSLFKTFIRSDFLCDAYYGMYADTGEKPGPSTVLDKPGTNGAIYEDDVPEQLW